MFQDRMEVLLCRCFANHTLLLIAWLLGPVDTPFASQSGRRTQSQECMAKVASLLQECSPSSTLCPFLYYTGFPFICLFVIGAL